MFPAERQFVTTAHSHLRALASEGGNITDTLSAIQGAAGQVQARAVQRAARLCQLSFKSTNDHQDAGYQHRLSSLRAVIQLYTDGLKEIDPEFTLTSPTPTNTIPAKQVSPPVIDMVPIQAANQNAKDVLTPLLELVKDDGRKSAFESLLTFPNSVQKKTDAPAKTASTPASISTRPPRTANKDVNFENIMREITTQVLREARLAAKTVSISYGAEFEMIDASLAPHFRKILQAFCVEIVRSGIQYEGDLTASLRRTWQISLSGSTDGQNLALVINWPGQVLSPNAALQTGFADLLALGGKFGSKTNRKNDRDVINGQDTGLDTHTLTLSFPVSIRTPAAPKVKAQIQDQEHITAQPTTQMVG